MVKYPLRLAGHVWLALGWECLRLAGSAARRRLGIADSAPGESDGCDQRKACVRGAVAIGH